MGTEVLKDKGRFDLDDHQSTEGHQILAKEIIKNLKSIL